MGSFRSPVLHCACKKIPPFSCCYAVSLAQSLAQNLAVCHVKKLDCNDQSNTLPFGSFLAKSFVCPAKNYCHAKVEWLGPHLALFGPASQFGLEKRRGLEANEKRSGEVLWN